MKLIISTLLLFILCYLGFINTDSIASSSQVVNPSHLEAEQIAAELSQVLSLDLEQVIFQGELFSQPISAWQFGSDFGFLGFVAALSKQNMIQQYQSLGNLIMLSGDHKQHNLLMHLERTGDESYRGFLSVMPNQGQRFDATEAELFQQYLLGQQEIISARGVPWLPPSATLLMDVQSTPFQSQQIYLVSLELESLQQEVWMSLTNLGWQKSSTDNLGLSQWTKGSQQLQLYFSQQAEGTALYVLAQDLTKDVYEITHK